MTTLGTLRSPLAIPLLAAVVASRFSTPRRQAKSKRSGSSQLEPVAPMALTATTILPRSTYS